MDKKRKKASTKQGCFTLKGYELALAEALDIFGVKGIRLGIKTSLEEFPSKEEIEKITNIICMFASKRCN